MIGTSEGGGGSQYAVQGRQALQTWVQGELAQRGPMHDATGFAATASSGGGEAATWTYRRLAPADQRLGLPPSEFTAMAVVRAGRVVRYEPDLTTTPAQRAANEAARATAAQAAATWQAAQPTQPASPAEATRAARREAELARATAAAASGTLGALPRPHERGTSGAGPWLLALGASLGGVVLLALLKRPREAP